MAWVGLLCCCAMIWTRGQSGILPPGQRPLPPGTHFLRGATVVPRPGERIEAAEILVRDGRIEAVGKSLTMPDDARVWELKGLTIYPGFIDPYLTFRASTNVLSPPPTDRHDHDLRSGGYRFLGVPGEETDPGSPGPGSSLAQIVPERRMSVQYTPEAKAIDELRELGFAAGNLVPVKGVLRGTSAFVQLANESPNRTILKADVFQHAAFETQGMRSPAFPHSHMGAIAAIRQAFFDARDYAARKEFAARSGASEAEPEMDLSLSALGPAAAGKVPVVFETGSALLTDRAGRLAQELGLTAYVLSSGQDWRRPDLARSNPAGFIVPLNFPEMPKLPDDDDWEALSLDQLRAWDWAPENAALLLQQNREIALTTYGLPERKNFRKNLRLAMDRGLSADAALAALTEVPARWCGVDRELGTIEPGKRANFTIVEGDYFIPTNKVRQVWVDGRVYHLVAAAPENAAKEGEKTDPPKEKAAAKPPAKARLARSPLEGRGPLATPDAILIRNATLWTSAEAGRLTNADFVVQGGKILSIGANLTAPEGTLVIDAQGRHVTPGLIDCHSHAMILGGVNEATWPSTAMVRVGDVVNSETRHLHEQLAGGLTTANLLHGSANPIGGQNCVIKLRDGASPEDLKFEGAPAGIKFALGENVKQANWGDNRTTRFPQTRMGVPTFMANRFTAARQYLAQRAERDRLRAAGEGATAPVPPPIRRDLELEALGEIIQGERLVHCHSYRQDEILEFLGVMENFGVRVATLQHVLEGYKIADEIARHGAGASCFSDWWAYKFEVIDAIPHAGTLMHERGVLVSFNSDSSDLARRMNTEAAKAVKYGGLGEEEAFNFVTINAAKQLRIDARVGSLEPGKDADFVIWSGSPLDVRSVCLETWIDGKKYFDRAQAQERAKSLEEERVKLLEKARQASKGGPRGGGGGGESPPPSDGYFEVALEHRHDGVERHCDSE